MLTFNNSTINFVMDGHSMAAGNATTVPNRIGEQLMQLPPISGGMTYKNVAVGGRTFKTMTQAIAAVHGAYEAGKQNLLFVLEGSNTAQGAGVTAAMITQDCKDYIAAAKAVHPDWRVYIIICPPIQEDAQPPVYNTELNLFHDYVRSNFSDLGAEGYVETRPLGGPLAYTTYYYDWNKFVGSGHYQDGTHLNAAGNAIVAQYIADMLPTIPDEAPALGTGSTTSAGASGNILLGWL